ncbi:MAG TPA: tetratricopeptide repeat protein [Nitrosopumilaceae archaeon]|nr:tetratricopeptide repeat protein [Nitrosopumilaceae archaeon]
MEELKGIDELFNNGMILRKTGNPKESILYFNKVLEINPDHLDALLNKGHAFGKIGRYYDAIICYDRVLKIESNNILGLINTGLCYHYLRDYEKAISFYDKILQTYPQHANALYHKACSKALQNKFDESIDMLEQAIKQDLTFRIKAKGDLDFDKMRDNERFIKFVSNWTN